MPGAPSEPSVSLSCASPSSTPNVSGTPPTRSDDATRSVANNFWGKDDAGVGPLFQRMHDAKTTCDELKAFYTARATIEEDFAKKLLALSKKPLGSNETGTLKGSMDVLKGEVESMAKAHQSIASQMKTELEEPLTAFSGMIRERRKIVQGGCEKILKLKMQQTQQVNKTRDRYEQDCLKIKGYLAQGHMVMGQEERKNKARLEKTQAALAGSNAEYEAAIKALEETTARWNRDWKAACDKFQDLEEERIDFVKASLWTFANVSSTVCVHDDESCEKVRVSLEDCEVEKDITSFILDRGTGQDIPDAPKYINFCRGDVSDDGFSEAAEENYSVAQFPRAGNPTYRSSSPNPSMSSSSQSAPSEVVSSVRSRPSPEPQSQPTSTRSRGGQRREHERREAERQDLEKKELERRENERREHGRRNSRDQRLRSSAEPLTPPASRETVSSTTTPSSRSRRNTQYALSQQSTSTPSRSQRYERDHAQRQSIQNTPHNEYPLDGMTMYCRPGNLVSDATSSIGSPVARPPSSHASGSDYSDPTSVSSHGDVAPPPSRGNDRRGSPTKMPQQQQVTKKEDDSALKRKSGFFSGGGPFRRKSKSEKEQHRQLQLQQQQQQQQQQLQQQQQQQQQQQLAQKEQRRIEAQRPEQAQIMPPGSSMSNRSNRGTWSPATMQRNMATAQNSQGRGGYESGSSNRRQQTELMIGNKRHESPEPIDPRASLALNVGGNVFDVSTPDIKDKNKQKPQEEEEVPDLDPIAQALAELKGVTKGSTGSRNTADRYFGLATPAPGSTPAPGPSSGPALSQRGTPLPGYAPKSSALGLPPPAFTSAQMLESTQRYVNQRDQMLEGPPQMPAAAEDNQSRNGSGRQRAKTMDYAGTRAQSRQSSHDGRNRQENNRSVSPIPNRSVSPRPQLYGDDRYHSASPQPMNSYSRGPSPNPYTQSRPGTANSKGQYTAYSHRSASPMPSGQEVALSNFRSHSPAPSHHSRNDSYGSRGRSHAGSVRGGYDGSNSRQSYYENSQVGAVATYQGGGGQVARPRSKSVVDTSRQYTRDGRPIMHYARAMYQYQAAIPEELSFAKGDILAILRQQDDGWWESEIVGVQGRPGLVPSNYLQDC